MTLASKTLDLMGLAAGADRRKLATAHHSEITDDFPARRDGPIEGIDLCESHAHMSK